MLSRRIIQVLLLLAAWSTPGALAAQAPAPFQLSTLTDGAPLRRHLTAYLDPSGRLTLDQLRAAPPPAVALPSNAETTFGYERAALWLAFRVQNSAAETQPFMLALDYPHLDYVTLYVVHDDGRREERVTGDAFPFAQREVRHPAFVFRLEAAAQSQASYYLRIQTSGALKAQLSIWQRRAFLEDQQDRNLGIWMFYGALLVLAVYNLGVYVMIRQREYLWYVGLLLALFSVIFTLDGHTFQYVLPRHPKLANQALPVCIALALVTGGQFAKLLVAAARGLGRRERIIGWWTPVGAALLVFGCFAEPGLALRVLLAAVAVALAHSIVELIRVGRARDPELRVYMLSWLPLMLAMPVQLLRFTNVLPPSPYADYSALIAIAIHGIITSLMLASRVNAMRAHLGNLNGQLAHNVSELQVALREAQDAREVARLATQAKDEFVATMSHELRTPLNAIINVPQGLLDDFTEHPTAHCSACGARFVLDPDERVDERVACPECAAGGTLVAGTRIEYQGDPARTTDFLRRIERSGRHLLQMVDGVLDFSKIEAGHLALQPTTLDLRPFLRDLIEEVGHLAAKRLLRIELQAAERPLPTVVDPTRVKQILLNLLSNAVKFTEEASTITVRWQALPEADVIEVQDQGIGIDPADHERVFQRFEQVHKGDTRKYGGTGLGLPISRSLARMHGGDLTVVSTPGAGSTFTLTLPRRALGHEARRNDAAE